MPLFVGIDGGGTRTTAVATDAEGRVRGRATGEAGLVNVLEPIARAGSLAALARAAAEAAGETTPVEAFCCGLAGAGRDPERMALQRALLDSGVALRVRVTTDAEAAMADAFGAGGAGILIIAGTGSIAWARDAAGRTARAGGWGYQLGDEGSAWALGMGALHAVVQAHDGRDLATALSAAVLEITAVSAPEGLIAWTAAASKGDVAALAPAVCAAAASGDPIAIAIVQQAAHDLAKHFRALYRRLAPWPESPVLALSGALVAPGGPLRPAVQAAVERIAPARPLDRPIDAAAGAAALARAL